MSVSECELGVSECDIYKQCEPTLIDTLIVGADVSKKHTLNDTLNSNSSKYVNLL